MHSKTPPQPTFGVEPFNRHLECEQAGYQRPRAVKYL
jgi:hypothetical protein